MKHKVEEFQEMYNNENKSMSSSPQSLVFFQEACEHVTRILRIIRQPLGHALLVGVGGSGLRSLARLATFIADYVVF